MNGDTLEKYYKEGLEERIIAHLAKVKNLTLEQAIASKLIQCSHRHCVFTINEDLRHFFLEDRSLLDCLFNAVRSVVLRMFYQFE